MPPLFISQTPQYINWFYRPIILEEGLYLVSFSAGGVNPKKIVTGYMQIKLRIIC